MRYHLEKPPLYQAMYGEVYRCDHPIYNACTLYRIGTKGLAVIQQRFNETTKQTRWEEIDPWLRDLIYIHPKFKQFFDDRAGEPENELYPTVTVRQIMWALKLKPIKRERWETYFDRRVI